MTGILLAAPLLSTALQAGEFLEWMHKADNRSEPRERIEYYSRALKAWMPPDGQALLAHCRFRRGEAFFDSGEFKQSQPDLDKALELDPRNARARLLRGRIHLSAGRLRKAALDLEEYAALAPEDMEALLLLGEAKRRRGKNLEALAVYRKAAIVEPADFRPALGESRVYMAMERWPQAQSCLDRADALAKHRDGEILSLRAAAQAALGQNQAALTDYSDSLPLHEGRLLHLKRSAAPAEETARQTDQTAGAYYGRGRLQEGFGRLTQARSDYKEACRLGHQEGCRKEAWLKPAVAEPAPVPKKKKKKTPKPADSPGNRIYAN